MSSLEKTLFSISFQAQEFCQNLIFNPGQHMNIQRALVCGTAINNPEYLIFKLTQLWHLIIVSGSHLIVFIFLLQFILKFVHEKIRTYIYFFILFSYAFLTGLGAPIVRSLLGLVIVELNKKLKLFMTQSECLLLSVLLVVILIPHYCNSISLLLSWAASCGLIISSFVTSPLKKATLMYGIIFPLLAFWGVPSGFGILFNTLIGPILSFLLFPLALTCTLLPILAPIFNFTTEFLIQFLNLFKPYLSSETNPHFSLEYHEIFNSKTDFILLMWLYIFVLTQIAIHLERKFK